MNVNDYKAIKTELDETTSFINKKISNDMLQVDVVNTLTKRLNSVLVLLNGRVLEAEESLARAVELRDNVFDIMETIEGRGN